MANIPKHPLILIDGSSYLYRAYHAFPFLTNSEGQPTGVIYGVLNMLRSLILKYKPTHAAIVFDTQGKIFRNEIFKHYKSNRLPMPNNLRIQIKPLHKMIKAMGLPLITVSGVEADDVIGTLAQKAEKIGYSVLIITNDKDMAQLVTPKIALMNTMLNKVLGPEEIIEKYGVPPELIIDLLALIGDASDNIPGVPGIGAKIAQTLLQELGGLNTLYTHIDKIKNLKLRGAKTLASKLEQNKDIAYLSYQLATIKTDIKLGLNCEQLAIQELAVDELLNLFKKYEFKHWITELELGTWLHKKRAKQSVLLPKETCSFQIKKNSKLHKFYNNNNYEVILHESQLIAWIEKFKKKSFFVLNTETDSVNNIFANLIGLSFSIAPGVAVYVPVSNYLNISAHISSKYTLKMLKPILEDDNIIKIGQNMKFSCSILKNYNIELRGIAFDNMLASYILNNIPRYNDMDMFFAAHWLNKKVSYLRDTGKNTSQLALNHTSLEEVSYYAAQNADINFQMYLKMYSILQNHKDLLNIFKNIEMPLVSVLSRMERNGVKIDSFLLLRYSKEIRMRLIELEQIAYKIAGERFNLSSTKQLQAILFEKQGIKPFKKTPSGAISTSEEVLVKLALNHPLPKVILEYRSLTKLKSTYADKLPLMISPKTGRIHTTYHQAVTITGRLSSTDPNLQNIPARNEEGRRIRQAFIAPENYMIVSADYSQIELRILAHLSHDKSLLTAFAEGKDIHSITATELFGLSLTSVTNEHRRRAKAINFGLIYGLSAFGLARQLHISYKKSQQYINLYFERYTGIRKYIERTRTQVKEKGYIETISGRRLYLPNIKSSNAAKRARAERAAINAPMQGTAAEIIKHAMIDIDAWLKKEQPRVRMIMQVHDELVFEVHKDDVKNASTMIHALMQNSMKLDVPLVVEVKSGKNWDQTY